MELTGTIKKIGDTQTFASGFLKREVVLLTDEQYPQLINIEFTQDKTDIVDYHKVGANVKIHINIRGREWTSPQGEVKYFNSIVGWRIESLAGEPTSAEPLKENEPTKANETNVFAEDEDDDLPF